MSSDLAKIEQTVSMSFVGEEVSRDLIEKRVRGIGPIMQPDIDEDDIVLIIKSIESNLQHTLELGSTIVDASYSPWVRKQSENIDWYYWNRYKQLLIKNGFGNNVVDQMDIIIDEILDLTQNPNDVGRWQRKGLVVGHVQSGKTANYSGLVCKALDAGYRIVIVMAGLLNSLRKQTQGRFDTGVIGVDSSLMLEDIPLREKLIGVGEFSCDRWPVSITTANADFNKPSATQQQAAINQYKPPLVFVVKKNVSILKNLIEWIKNNNMDLSEQPMLLIDDEADHASINTKNDDYNPTKTNERIRDLLNLFPKNVYIGYTATPFANIFIDPNTPQDMMNDLFPRNFIKTLEAPSNYLGAKRLFLDEDPAAIRSIDDHQSFLPLNHKIDELPEVLPESLKHAIRSFVLVCSIRVLREHQKVHNSMLINVSRFTGVQSRIRELIHSYLTQLTHSVKLYYALDEIDALKNTEIYSLHHTWETEYINSGFKWESIQAVLNKAISNIQEVEINSSPNGQKEVDYSERNYSEGRSVIAIGGLSLSRGITLEGLSVTYFLRNSIMYDTLMQMGRWFGFRPDYEDLCRVFITDQARGWYEHIADATEELRNELREMDRMGRTPEDFGLCVRNHPDSLIVTARNKMRTATTVIREIDLSGRLIETARLFSDEKKIRINLKLATDLLFTLKSDMDTKLSRKVGKTVIYQNVAYNIVYDFIEAFQNHPESDKTNSQAVSAYIESLAQDQGIVKWNVAFVSVEPDVDLNINPVEGLKDIGPAIRRNVHPIAFSGIMLNHRRVGKGGIEYIDLDENRLRQIPLLMIHILDCRSKKEASTPLFPNGVVAYGIAFPGEKYGRRIKKLATYQVNTTYMKKHYGNDIETDDDILGELD